MLSLDRSAGDCFYIANSRFRVDVLDVGSQCATLRVCGQLIKAVFYDKKYLSIDLNITAEPSAKSSEVTRLWIDAPKSVNIARGEIAKFDSLGNLIRPKK